MDSANLPIFANLVLAVQCCIAAYMDFRHRQLPNLLCLSVLGTGIVSGIITHDMTWVGLSLAHAALALLFGIALFAGAVIGGGDAKFYAAVAAWLPLKYGFLMLGAVAVFGFVLALAWFPLRARIAAMAPDPETAKGFTKVPFGLAIAAGGWFTYVVSTGLWSVQS
jgi:prepilin peptidase CpaA